MRFIYSNGPRRCLIVFQKHEVTQQGLHRRLERSLFIRPPEIVSVADRLLDAIVEVVSVGRPRVRLDFDARQQTLIRDGQEIPSLGRPEITREVGIYLPGKYFGISDACLLQNLFNDPQKTIKLLSSGDFGSSSLIADFAAAASRA